MAKHYDVEDLILNYDPSAPQARFMEAGIEGAALAASERLPDAVPWPEKTAPVAAPLAKAPAEGEDLTKFKGYDAVVMTWTVAEAVTLAALMSPGYPLAQWYEYRHNVQQYIPLVTTGNAPFNDRKSDRYYHSLAVYFPCRVGKARVLLMKSGLHLDKDGMKLPVSRLVKEVVDAVQPSMFITTGTGGGIGTDVKLGDVVIGGTARFYCTKQFKKEPWCTASYTTSPLPAGTLAAIAPSLTKVNAAKIGGARPVPKIWAGAGDAVVTTDFFGFDDSTNHFGLQGLGRACDMGDAMVGQVLRQYPKIPWFAIRNASDPQIPNPDNNIREAGKVSGEIYAKYGALTTAASVIASWAVIASAFT
ncbi:MAG TPA: hypothetical protein VLY83_02195 [Methanoregula sp.]|nr:hypothetical protein [Methanoregula sp.]